jgi:hypothetical protein
MINWIKNIIDNWRFNHRYFKLNEIQAGGHCGVCGKWIPDVVVPKDWPWDMCEDHISDEERKILIQAKKNINSS